ncbi:hypothetical protein NQ318_004841, partial [Aromia moschata]
LDTANQERKRCLTPPDTAETFSVLRLLDKIERKA